MPAPTFPLPDGRRVALGSYKHQAQADLAESVALLLQAHFRARDGGGQAPNDEAALLGALPAAGLGATQVADIKAREEWQELAQCADLEAALKLLPQLGLAEQVRALRGGAAACACCVRGQRPGGGAHRHRAIL